MKTILLVTALAAIFSWASNQDYRDAQAEMAYQCSMIERGHWPSEVNPHCPRKKEVVSNEK